MYLFVLAIFIHLLSTCIPLIHLVMTMCCYGSNWVLLSRHRCCYTSHTGQLVTVLSYVPHCNYGTTPAHVFMFSLYYLFNWHLRTSNSVTTLFTHNNEWLMSLGLTLANIKTTMEPCCVTMQCFVLLVNIILFCK